MPTASALGKTFCPQCGWNREAAEKQTRLFLRLLPVLVIVFDAPLIVWIFVGHASVPILGLLGAIAVIPGVLVVLVMRSDARISASVSTGEQSLEVVTSQARGTPITAPTKEMAKKYKTLVELQRPRAVRFSRQGKMTIAIITMSLLVFGVALITMVMVHPGTPRVPAANGTAAPSRPLLYLLPIALVVVIAFLLRRSLAQQRWLLELGELAMGSVTKQWNARNGSGIRYEFTTSTGETLSRITTDNFRQLLPGMSVPIFYDPQEPSKQVALCASFYEFVSRRED